MMLKTKLNTYIKIDHNLHAYYVIISDNYQE